MLTRERQNTFTWILAAGLLVSQLIPVVPHRPELIVGAFGLLGLPSIRKVQDSLNGAEEEK